GTHERQYAASRHNVGARAVERAARAIGLRPTAGLNPIPLSRSGIVLPDGFMNDSGGLLRRAVQRWHPSADHLLVVHDELDLPLGEVQLKAGGGHGGHNGLRDIIAQLGTPDFRRLRVGVGRPSGGVDPADYVLGSFRPEERVLAEGALAAAEQLVLAFLESDRV
ncbi:MAG: peptidyl-tRNA hydrolase, partial [Chloroflexi bacterium]|nr:peptidyl-tRNA hydrolase [Chloroflexota bacterium]